jgi:branched-chain amino acid transport system ATP-binding protein
MIGILQIFNHIKLALLVSVIEHLVLAARTGNGAGWNVERIFDLFPRLKERKKQSGASLSGGEQQMLAIGRALITNPSLLVMDEPSEGLAPVVLDLLIETYHSLVKSGISILIVEQNLRTATSLTDDLYIMIAGCIVDKVKGELLLHDQHAREQFLGVKVKAF